MARKLTLGLLISCALFSASAQEVIINELYNSGGTDEWVELLVVNERKFPGRYSVVFDASRLTSGVYFCWLQAEGYAATKKMIVVR
jgi:hypothetical protein